MIPQGVIQHQQKALQPINQRFQYTIIEKIQLKSIVKNEIYTIQLSLSIDEKKLKVTQRQFSFK